MNFRLPKWAVLAVVAAVFLPLAADWVAPGEGARLAAGWLESACRGDRDGTGKGEGRKPCASPFFPEEARGDWHGAGEIW